MSKRSFLNVRSLLKWGTMLLGSATIGSQQAFCHDAGDRFEVASAGVEPTQVRPLAIKAMNEIGIDISGHRSKSVDEFEGQNFDYVITVCDNANQQCPMFPGTTQRIHWSIEDPAAVVGSEEEQLKVFQRVRDELRDKLREFAAW